MCVNDCDDSEKYKKDKTPVIDWGLGIYLIIFFLFNLTTFDTRNV